jgi:hypothetical protein
MPSFIGKIRRSWVVVRIAPGYARFSSIVPFLSNVNSTSGEEGAKAIRTRVVSSDPML